MTTAVQLLKAPRYGIRDFKSHLSERIRSKKAMILVDRGEPKKVIMDYDELVGLLELVEDLHDKELMQLVREGRAAAERGERGISVERSFASIKAKPKA
jgi:hypothetical protein